MAHRIDIDMNKIHPWMQYKVNLWLKKLTKEGYSIILTMGYRSIAEQNALYAQGRTKSGSIVTNARGGSSQHNYGIAVDFALNMDVNGDGKINSNDTFNDTKGHFKKIATIAKSVGLAWGGDWTSLIDKPHIYLPKWGSTPTKIINQYGTFENFKKTWTSKATYKTGTRIRKTKLFSSKVLTIIPRGNTCAVLWKSKLGYSKVGYKNVVGYAKNKYLK